MSQWMQFGRELCCVCACNVIRARTMECIVPYASLELSLYVLTGNVIGVWLSNIIGREKDVCVVRTLCKKDARV